jgi:medium-chain acyl-[acyl-carrier-protein] hydrolase
MQRDLTLFCIPHAGGGASAYRGWAEALAPHVAVKVLQLPGRESRFREPTIATLAQASNDLHRQMGTIGGRPFALFGHSMGGILAFELAHRLRDSGSEPAHLFVSASSPPDRAQVETPISHLPDAAFVEQLDRRYGGIPTVMLKNADLLAAFLPALRADFAILEGYRLADRPLLNCPLAVFCGRDDNVIDQSALRGWELRTSGKYINILVGGNHFYLQLQRGNLTRLIKGLLFF